MKERIVLDLCYVEQVMRIVLVGKNLLSEHLCDVVVILIWNCGVSSWTKIVL
jgi:hypothetical protein